MAIKNKKISELPLAHTLHGLETIGVDENNRSVRANLGFVQTAADEANAAALSAYEAAKGVDTAVTEAQTAATTANNAATNAGKKAEVATTSAALAEQKAAFADEKATLAGKATENAITAAGAANTAAERVDGAITNAQNATTAANNAATNADKKAITAASAAASASSAAQSANAAASDANKAKIAAEAAATSANTAASGVIEATALANNAASSANTAAVRVEEATTTAVEAANKADAAASNAASKASSADSAATLADQKATLADQKATLANDAATVAKQAAEGVNTAILEANKAADAANEAAQGIKIPSKTSQLTNDSGYVTDADIQEVATNKVDKVSGKGLSTEDFTTLLKQRLEGLANYDDKTIRAAVTAVQNQLDTLLNGDVNGVIDAFNEIETFLAGITDAQTLTGLLSNLRMEVIALIPTKVSQLTNDAGYATGESVAGAVSAAVEVEKSRAEIAEAELSGRIDGMGGGSGKSFVFAEGASGKCLMLLSESDPTRARIMIMWSEVADFSAPGSYLVTFNAPGFVIPADLSPVKVDELMDYVKQNVDAGDGNPPADPIGTAAVFFDAVTISYMMQMMTSNFATKDEVAAIGRWVDVSGWTGVLPSDGFASGTYNGQITENWQPGAVYVIYYGSSVNATTSHAANRTDMADIFVYPKDPVSIGAYCGTTIPGAVSYGSSSRFYILNDFAGKSFRFSGHVIYKIYRVN